MSLHETRLPTQARASSTQPPISKRTGLLRRKCACGGTPGASGECAGCRRKRLQRHPANQAEPSSVPSIVHDVLHSPGQPLDPATRAFMEPRFGHRFGDVRVHAEASAAESARALDAQAYTVGRDVIFGPGRYEPSTPRGRKLLAHELAHVVQQRESSQGLQTLRVGSPDDKYESEAERASGAVARGEDAPRRRLSAPEGVQRLIVDAPEEELAGGAAPSPPAVVPCTPAPVATLDAFNNTDATSARNCCAICPVNLGVGADGRARNGMEMRIKIANHCPGAEYEITRVRESWLWHRVGGVWSELEHQGPGVNDDHHDDDDECHRLRRRRFLYVEDRPGWHGIALPAQDGTTFPGYTGVRTDPAATEVVSQDTFAEWVIYRHRGHGIPWTAISSPRFFYWRSILWLQKSPFAVFGVPISGPMWRLAPASEIESGYRSAVVKP